MKYLQHLINIRDILVKIKAKDSLKTFCRQLLLRQFHLMPQILCWKNQRTTSQYHLWFYSHLWFASYNVFSRLRSCSIQTLLVKNINLYLKSVLAFALCFLLVLFWLLGLVLEEAGAHHQHTQQRNPPIHPLLHPLLHHRDHCSSSTATSSLAALRSKVSAHSCSHSSSSSFIPQPLPAAKSSPFPPQLAFGQLTVLIKLQKNTQLVLQGRVFCHLSEQIYCKMGSKEPSGHEARALTSQAAGLGWKYWGEAETGQTAGSLLRPGFTLHINHCVQRSIAKSDTLSHT